MAPKGYLDVHCHFFPGMTDEIARGYVNLLRDAHFMVEKPSQLHWSAEGVIKYNDHAGVAMSLLSFTPNSHEKLREGNDFARQIVKRYRSRFGHLLALPTDSVDACLAEIQRGEEYEGAKPDGYAMMTQYNNVLPSDPRLSAVYDLLDSKGAVLHLHPNAFLPGQYGKPSALIDVAFDTARVATDMLYKGIFRKYPNIKFIFGHCGGALPALSGRLALLGTEYWVPNPENITREEIETQLSKLYVDTAATAKTGLPAAVRMVGWDHCIYGADCGTPCSSWDSMDENLRDISRLEAEAGVDQGTVRDSTWKLFPAAAERAEQGQN